MKAYEDIKVYQPKPCCAVCKGSCCRRMACHYSPRDFKDLSFESLKKEIEKGRISIDWWEAEEPEYYLRARHVNASIVDPSFGGICINLTEDGCSLSFEDRPLGGKAVKPDPMMRCQNSYTKEMCKEEWKPYSQTLKRLAEYFSSQCEIREEN